MADNFRIDSGIIDYKVLKARIERWSQEIKSQGSFEYCNLINKILLKIFKHAIK